MLVVMVSYLLSLFTSLSKPELSARYFYVLFSPS
jgi:hypothetical protein